MNQPLKEFEDFYFNKEGNMVLTAKYLLLKKDCCGNGCLHCPYNYKNVPEVLRLTLLKARKLNNQ